MRIQLLFALLTLLALRANGQQLLKIDLSNRCIFYPQGQEEELYSFPTAARDVPQLVADLLALAGETEQNFTLLQANVENVSAVVDSTGRYLLWNPYFLEYPSPILGYVAFAHEMAHHLYRHRLTTDYNHIEEREADVFMGLIIGKSNIPLQQILPELDTTVFRASTTKYDRREAVMEGYRQAEKSLKLSALAFDNDPAWNAFQKAAFTFPPPQCYQLTELSRQQSFYDCKTLGDVSKRIGWAFDIKGYPYRFMSIPSENGNPEGFAVVTQLEQYEADGSILADGRLRWQELPKTEDFSFSMDYFKSLLFPRRAHLRLFVVLVTRQSYSSNTQRVSKEVARAWIDQGLNRLPTTIANKPFQGGYSVDLLVYEFEVPESSHKPQQNCPCFLNARTHLRASGLDNWLR